VHRRTRSGDRPIMAPSNIQRSSGPVCTMFLFFSRKLGWLGSVAVSIVLSLLLILLFAIF
jgi:hypothetical protein